MKKMLVVVMLALTISGCAETRFYASRGMVGLKGNVGYSVERPSRILYNTLMDLLKKIGPYI